MRTPPPRARTKAAAAPAVAAFTDSGSGGVATRRPARWPRIGVVLAAVGLLAVGVAVLNTRVRVSDPGMWLQGLPIVQAFIGRWADVLAEVTLAAAAAIVVIGVSWRLLRRRHRELLAKVMTACSAGVRVPVAQLQLSKAKWRRGGEGLVRARLRYRPAAAVIADHSAAIAEALTPFLAATVDVRWERRRNQFAITPKPVVPLRLEEKYADVGKLAEALAHIVGKLEVDQRRSTVTADGSVQQLVARYAHTTRDIGDGFRQRVQTVLDAKAPSPTGYWTVRWNPAANEVIVLPSEPLPTKADYPLALPGVDEQMLIPLGPGDGGQIVYWKPALFPHLLVVGPTGTGKTIFLFSLIISCLMRGWIICLLDPKELSFRGFDPRSLVGRGLPTWGGIVSVATSEAEMEDGIGFFHENMRNRYAAIKGFEVSEDDLPPVMMIVDEAGELVERLSEYHTSEDKMQDLAERASAEGRDPSTVTKPKGTKNPELRKIWSGLRLGRQGRDFVVTATQRPDVSFIPGEARSNLTTRVGLGHLDGAALEMVFNTRAIQQRVFELVVDPVTGQRQRQRVRGRATVDVGAGPQTIQTFFVPDPANAILGKLSKDDENIVKQLHELVDKSRQRWAHQQEAPVVSGRLRRASIRDFERHAEELDTTEQVTNVEMEAQLLDCQEVRAGRLKCGDAMYVHVDGVRTPVEIEEIEDDPYEPEDLQFTYRIGDGPNAGQVEVTSFNPDEDVLIPA